VHDESAAAAAVIAHARASIERMTRPSASIAVDEHLNSKIGKPMITTGHGERKA
jgi:hypothetical protein